MSLEKTQSILDETELRQLEAAVADAEHLIASGQGTAMLRNFCDSAKRRLETLREEIGGSDGKRDKAAEIQMAAVEAAAREHRLNSVEKQMFAGFLEKEFFTKSDFGSLEEFYEGTWDRLSEEGKTAMSQRVWGGIRSGEYTFDELPEVVKKKESERLHELLVSGKLEGRSEAAIPEQDRRDFIEAYEAGDQNRVDEVLGRESFVQNVARESGSAHRINARTQTVAESKPVQEQAGTTLTDDQGKLSASLKEVTDVDKLELAGLVLADGNGDRPHVEAGSSDNVGKSPTR